MATLNIHTICALSQDNYEAVMKLTESTYATPNLIKDTIEASGTSAQMRYVGSTSDISVVSKDPLTILEIWENPYFPGDPAYMVGLYSQVTANDQGKAEKHPQEWLLGPKANFFVNYKMSCCGGLSSLISMNLSGDNRQSFIRDDKRNTHDNQRNFFEGKLLLDTPDDGSAYNPETSRLYHIYLHRTDTKHDCAHHQDYTTTANASPAPGLK